MTQGHMSHPELVILKLMCILMWQCKKKKGYTNKTIQRTEWWWHSIVAPQFW